MCEQCLVNPLYFGFEEMLGKTIVRKIAEGINASQYKTPVL